MTTAQASSSMSMLVRAIHHSYNTWSSEVLNAAVPSLSAQRVGQRCRDMALAVRFEAY